MSRKPWKRKSSPPRVELTFGAKTNGSDGPAPGGSGVAIESAPASESAGIPPPLPPLPDSPAPADPGSPAAGMAAPVFDETKIKAGMGQAFCSVTQGGARIINYALRNGPYRVEFSAVTSEEGHLWAEFAFPVLKSWLPNVERNPVTVLCVMTGLILSGKIRIKKTEVVTNVRPEESRSEAHA